MDKNKKKKQRPSSTKNGSEKQASASDAKVQRLKDPISSKAQSDFPSLPTSIAPTGEATPHGMLEKKISDLKISESAVQTDEQQKAASQLGTKPKTIVYSGGEQIGQKADKFHIYQVSGGRKKFGKLGKTISLRTNHFPMKINIPGEVIYQYDVEFTFSDKIQVKNQKLLLEAINLLKDKYSKIFLNPHAVVFDGLKNVFTCQELKFSSGKFEGEVEIKEDADAPKELQIKVTLKYARCVNVNNVIAEYCRRGVTETKPYYAMQALNIVLSMTPKFKYETIGRNHFDTHPKNGKKIEGNLSLWVGTFTSVRIGWEPMLNVDMVNRVIYDKSLTVEEFIKNVLSKWDFKPFHLLLNEKRYIDIIDEKIKSIKIQYNRPDGYKRDYRVIRMMPAANRLKMKPENGEECTIEKYFKDKYEHQLEFPNYPCIHVGKPHKTVYLPIELCMIKKQSLPTTSLTDDQNKTMIDAAAKSPKKRYETIVQNLRNLSNHYDTDPYASTFGLRVSDEMLKIEGRELVTPVLKYKNAENKEIEFKDINNGKWLVGRQAKNALKFLTPIKLEHWGVLDLSNLPKKDKELFVDSLYREGELRGMFVNYPKYDKANAADMSQVKANFEKLYDSGCVQLIMVINAKKGPVRDELKYLGDTKLRVPTQFVMKKVCYKILGKDSKGPNAQALHNLCLKINHKLGGVNHALSTRPPIMNRPVMFMGADVTHPAPGDVSKKPSIAAVVGSTDFDISQFNVEIRLQYKGKDNEEIEQMEEMTYNLLQKFYRFTGESYIPEEIVYYRDGVSEGQFPAVLKHELRAIRRAYAKFKVGREPKVTFIIAQKRHKTRFFEEYLNDGIGENNIQAGTVVDTKITTLSEIDFFLASHKGLKVIIL